MIFGDVTLKQYYDNFNIIFCFNTSLNNLRIIRINMKERFEIGKRFNVTTTEFKMSENERTSLIQHLDSLNFEPVW